MDTLDALLRNLSRQGSQRAWASFKSSDFADARPDFTTARDTRQHASRHSALWDHHTLAVMDHVNLLPPELLHEVFSRLEPSPPADAYWDGSDWALDPCRMAQSREFWFYGQPTTDMFRQPRNYHPLYTSTQPVPQQVKTISLVCHRWRDIVLPRLFRHVLWSQDFWSLLCAQPAEGRTPAEFVDAIPLLRFLRESGLASYVRSIVVFVGDSVRGAMLAGAPIAARRPSTVAGFGRGRTDLIDHARLPEEIDQSSPRQHTIATAMQAHRMHLDLSETVSYNMDNNWLWDVLFDLVDPLEITLVGTPQILASLLSCEAYLGDAWSRNLDLVQLLRLSREHDDPASLVGGLRQAAQARSAVAAARSRSLAPRPGPSKPSPARTSANDNDAAVRAALTGSALFTARPWTELLLNEGSSYHIYERRRGQVPGEARPPSVLVGVLGLVPATVQWLIYVAVFPPLAHLWKLVTRLPPVDRFSVQLTPRAQFDYLGWPLMNMGGADEHSFHQEAGNCYRLLLSLLGKGVHEEDPDDDDDAENPQGSPWKCLRVFQFERGAYKHDWMADIQ